MFARCPECRKKLPLTVEQLRESRGMLRCEQCSCTFDALPFISEGNAIDDIVVGAMRKSLPWEKTKQPPSRFWSLGVILGLAMLMAQFLYFEGYALTQKPHFRLWAEKLCDRLKCQLPAYRNLDELEVLHRSFTVLPDGNYVFKIVFSNQAAFRQNYPNIKLTLLNFSGRPFARRMILPKDYLSDPSQAETLEANTTREISLEIAAPQTKVGGYDFEFTY
ncbi:MAG: zinc-ribbon and DUF3426 domain-containing protein [Methylosarcina sp.]